MPIRLSMMVLAIALAGTAAASTHNVTIAVVSSSTEDATVPDGGAWNSQSTITSVTGAENCPHGSTAAGGNGNGTLTQCQWSNLSLGGTQGKQTTVRAFLTTASGEVFDISMVCIRKYVTCAEPKAGSKYSALLDDAPKYLADYAPRREYGTMKVKFAPDGRKLVSYDIIFSMRAGSRQSHPD